ncbi:Ser/Thr protein phosphatase [Tritrichomonas foetus]|uniref:Serine/threonine-protein phosphatase n=1 Tax=Tritrichomonas foetus TaxID=1144522 RepID=A0A1J4L1D9_9EUKA|nr:Ser/Thr protein phosphatase [Tritrichomonas foetus]|eukprot:OHT17335.1 Ser/Thr protein phosphatase [Tritrichomonas foetus]
MYQDIISHDVTEYENESIRMILPVIPPPIIGQLTEKAAQIFEKEPNLLIVNCDVAVVGDLHGHILDLFRILKNLGFPPERNYLFLGDFVDRGEFSTETITLILIMKILFPEQIFIIRGNHEFPEMWSRCGFSNEVDEIYDNPNVKHCFQKSFSYIPLAALVNDSILCVHGGIGPNFMTLGQISDVKRPLQGYDDELITSVVWSDPSPQVDEFQMSTRGSGYIYGKDSLARFLKSQVLDLLVRGHECVNGGIEYSLGNLVVTVFSASNYCGMMSNKAGVLILNKDKTRENKVYPSLRYFRRLQARFVESDDDFVFNIPQSAIQQAMATPLPTLNKGKGVKSSETLRTLPMMQRRISIDKSVLNRPSQMTPQFSPPAGVVRRKSTDFGIKKAFSARQVLLKDDSVINSNPTLYNKLQPSMPMNSTRTQPPPRRLVSPSETTKHEIKMPPAEQFPSFRKKHFSDTLSEGEY